MSEDPNELIRRMTVAVGAGITITLAGSEIHWLLCQLKHRDDRIAALSKLAEPDPRTPPFPGELARTAAFWEPMLGLPPGAIPDEMVTLCLEAAELSRRCGRVAQK